LRTEWTDRKVLVVIAHPDDETLGCGGTVRKITEAGAEVTVILALRRNDPRGRENWDRLIAALHEASGLLGAQAVVLDPLLWEPQAEPEVHLLHDALLPWVEAADVVFTHWPGDVNQAHRGVARAIEIATRPFRRRRDVYLFEIPTSTDQAFFQTYSPNTWFALTESQCKVAARAMGLYQGEHDPGRTAGDLLRRQEMRGAQIGVAYAEAFVVIRRFE